MGTEVEASPYFGIGVTLELECRGAIVLANCLDISLRVGIATRCAISTGGERHFVGRQLQLSETSSWRRVEEKRTPFLAERHYKMVVLVWLDGE